MTIGDWPPRRAARGAWLCLAFAAACGGSGDGGSPKGDDQPPKEHRSAADSPMGADEPSPTIEVAANDPMSTSPFDATPSPDGQQIYYTALSRGDDGESAPAVFAVAASGGAITRLAVGEPLSAPVNISVSLDGKQLYVADPAAGAVFSLAATGGTPSAVGGTEGYAPRGVTVVKGADGREYVYFSGQTADGVAGLFRFAGGGGAVETVASGEPFADPAGVTVTAMGVAYVVETTPESATARVIRVENGSSSVFAEGIGIGFPAGIAMTRDDATVLVSGLDPATKHDVVYFVATSDASMKRLTKTVGAFHEPAGLHRAHEADVFAWADSEAKDHGTVFSINRRLESPKESRRP